MMKLHREDWIFLGLPFVLTAIFIIFGYQILVSTTPEASIKPSISDTSIKIITDGDIKPISNEIDKPTLLTGSILSIPQNESQLELLLEKVKQTQSNVAYLSLPITMKSDTEFQLSGADLSSEENIRRWLKLTINQLHRENVHVMLGLTINATMTVNNVTDFTNSYASFIEGLAVLSNEFDVTYFSPGITIGHPLYSTLSVPDQQRMLATIKSRVGSKFNGDIGVNVCCTQEALIKPSGYQYLVVIPTPEFPFATLAAVIDMAQKSGVKSIVYYDRDQGRVRSNIE